MTKKQFLVVLLFLFAGTSFAQIFEPVKWNFELKKTSGNTADIQIIATIDDGWHVYGLNIPKDGPRATSITFDKIENAQKAGELQATSKLEKQFDANFNMELNWYSESAVFVQKIKFTDPSKVKVKGHLEFMACNDKNCLPPTKKQFMLSFAADITPSTVEAVKPVVTAKTSDYWTPVIRELKSFGDTKDNTSTSFWLIFLAGLVGGFLALFTPCVWPIIPMTVSFFLKRSENKKLGQRDAILYLSLIHI